jgi:hypothetical protein
VSIATRLRLVWLLWTIAACNRSGVGDPCIAEDEYRPEFSGFSKDEVNVESRSFQCETRLCLVNKFQGRVSCPYGGTAGHCETPDQSVTVSVPVAAQLAARPPSDAVYCSCRCAGPDTNAPYCECPEGFECAELVPALGVGDEQLQGGYCVKQGTNPDSDELAPKACDPVAQNCER